VNENTPKPMVGAIEALINQARAMGKTDDEIRKAFEVMKNMKITFTPDQQKEVEK